METFDFTFLAQRHPEEFSREEFVEEAFALGDFD